MGRRNEFKEEPFAGRSCATRTADEEADGADDDDGGGADDDSACGRAGGRLDWSDIDRE